MAEGTPIQKNSSTNNEDYQRVGFFETLKIAKWSFSIFYKYHPKASVLILITRIIFRLQSLAYVYLTARVINILVDSLSRGVENIRFIFPYMGALLGINILTSLVDYVYSRSRNIISANSFSFLRRELYLKMKDLGIGTLEDSDVNNKITRVSSYLYQTQNFFMSFVELAAGLVRLLTYISLIMGFMPELGILILVATIPYSIADRIYRKEMFKFDYINTEEDRRHSSAGWDLSNVEKLREIVTTGSFSYLDKKFIDFKNWYNSTWLKIMESWTNWQKSLTIFSDILIVVGYIGIVRKFLTKSIGVGEVTFWMSSLDALRSSVSNTIQDINSINERAVRIKDTYSFFMMEPMFSPGDTAVDFNNRGPRIELENVSFQYPSSPRKVISDLNLTINQGDKIAIVGENGAGKTTLVKLISRFYPVNEGRILINGINVNEIEPNSLYDNIGILQQDYNRYEYLTVKENICIGKPDIEVDKKRMAAAARSADIVDFVEKYPNKYEQILSEKYKGGIKPSTGQWQKIALARFFYRNSPLVIFDEPTAAIDANSEAKIFTKIYEFFENKTVIIISHRFSTVRNADRIIVLDDGQIVEQGTHEELIKLGGKYANSFKLQAEGYKE